MSKAEEFIKNHTNNQANISIKISNGEIQSNCIPWVTSEQARKAVEIAREEIIEWINSHWREYVNVDADGIVCFGHWKNDLRKAMKDE